jgi:hypothetical protein
LRAIAEYSNEQQLALSDLLPRICRMSRVMNITIICEIHFPVPEIFNNKKRTGMFPRLPVLLQLFRRSIDGSMGQFAPSSFLKE